VLFSDGYMADIIPALSRPSDRVVAVGKVERILASQSIMDMAPFISADSALAQSPFRARYAGTAHGRHQLLLIQPD
jgi:hypothetical protein